MSTHIPIYSSSGMSNSASFTILERMRSMTNNGSVVESPKMNLIALESDVNSDSTLVQSSNIFCKVSSVLLPIAKTISITAIIGLVSWTGYKVKRWMNKIEKKLDHALLEHALIEHDLVTLMTYKHLSNEIKDNVETHDNDDKMKNYKTSDYDNHLFDGAPYAILN